MKSLLILKYFIATYLTSCKSLNLEVKNMNYLLLCTELTFVTNTIIHRHRKWVQLLNSTAATATGCRLSAGKPENSGCYLLYSGQTTCLPVKWIPKDKVAET